jgi:PAS domain S-box-containing protein
MLGRSTRGGGAEQLVSDSRPFEELTIEMPVVIDDAGWIIRAGNSWERLLGHAPEQLTGTALTQHVHPGDADLLQAELRKAREDPAGPVRFECRFANGDGRYVWVELDLRNSGNGLLQGIVRDITDRRLAADAVGRAQEQADSAKRAEGAFMSRMSHELRTPLTSVIGFSELLKREGLTSEQELKVDNVLKAARHLLSLIDEVLDVSRVESRTLDVSPEPVAIRGLLADTLELARPQASERGIEIASDLDSFRDFYVMADPQRLRQVVLNLLSNAIKYNRAAGEVEVTCEATREQTLRVHVRDTGPGLDESMLERLFVPFDRLGAEETSIPGTGLGLVLSRRLVELMGGTLAATSELGEGSMFTIELGLAEKPAPREEAPAAPEPAVRGRLSGTSVLIVEDNPTNLKLIAEVLAASGAEVVTARDGRSGLTAARQRHPDLIVLDVHLPDFDGDKVLEALRRDMGTCDIPVVALSADATREQRRGFFDRGVADYVTKPFEADALVESASDAVTRGVPAGA